MREREENTRQPEADHVLGLVPSPDHCERIASRIKDTLPDRLKRAVPTGGPWKVSIESDPLTGSNVDIADILRSVEERRQKAGWDYAIALTDLPIRENGTTILAERASGQSVAILSVPALGVFQVDRKATRHLVRLTAQLAEEREKGDRPDDVSRTDVQIVRPRLFSTVKLLAGMVYANRPWSLFPSFRTTVATAFATGGYGLIFSTLWEIGNVYGYARLTTLMVVAMTILVSWIVIAHDLWERHREGVTQYERALYNATTVTTIAVGVVFAYSIIFVLLLFAAVVYIPASMLESKIGMAVTPMSYVRIAWVTSSVATIAGAIGAGLEKTEAVRNATFGWRQIARWKAHDQEQKEEE